MSSGTNAGSNANAPRNEPGVKPKHSVPSNLERSCIMKKSLSIALAILLGGSTSVALAQSPQTSFAATIATMQSLSSRATAYQLSKPVFSKTPDDPTTGLSISEMQARSSEAPAWQLDHGKVTLDS